MYDSSQRPPTPRRQRRRTTADDDALRQMGFRDCAAAALCFLVDRAHLHPDSAVVRRVRRLLNRHAAADVDVQRLRPTVGAENRPPTARRRLYGRVSRRRGPSRRQHAPSAAVVDPSACGAATDRTGPPSDGELRQRRALSVLQATSTTTSSTRRTSPSDVECERQRGDVQPCASDVVDYASLLVDLSRSDARVRDLLTELMQLIDAE